MKYAKPEVTLIAAATAAICGGAGKVGIVFESPVLHERETTAAYEADE